MNISQIHRRQYMQLQILQQHLRQQHLQQQHLRQQHLRQQQLQKQKNIQHIKKSISNKPIENMDIGFIILRHMSCNKSALYYKFCYKYIRRYYPKNKIIIIDDHSKSQYIDKHYEKTLKNVEVIQSKYPKGSGELLPYLYFLEKKFFDTAVILHDSCFIQNNIDFSTNTYKFIWSFNSRIASQDKHQRLLIRKLKNHDDILRLHDQKHLWKGCFGAQTIIKYSFLKNVNEKYNLFNLVNNITCRYHRMSFERVIACILQTEKPYQDLLGDIMMYCTWDGTNFNDIYADNLYKYTNQPIVKLWTGR